MLRCMIEKYTNQLMNENLRTAIYLPNPLLYALCSLLESAVKQNYKSKSYCHRVITDLLKLIHTQIESDGIIINHRPHPLLEIIERLCAIEDL